MFAEILETFGVDQPSSSKGKKAQLKIALRHIHPQIWRRIVVSGNCSFDQLHGIIQAIMPWRDSKMYRFSERFSDPEGVPENLVLSEVITTLNYEYGPVDIWYHRIVVERVFDHNPNPNGAFCRVVDGRRACPPEGCGGAAGYENLLEALSDPDHPRHVALSRWMTNRMGYELPFDPGRFDLQEANKALENL